MVRGEPGVGKSALLDELASQAADATVLRTQGLEVEAPLAFAALHRLLLPLARLRTSCPPPGPGPASGAGRGRRPSVEPFLVGVATLSLLTPRDEEENLVLCGRRRPLAGSATAGALLFCARRLGADRVAMVFSARGSLENFDPQGSPRCS